MILVAHGAKAGAAKGAFLDRNFLDLHRVERFFQRRSVKFVDLEVALAGEGDALTIDDATRGAAAMALAARQAGHEVTLFVNPGYVSEAKPYYFHMLSLFVSSCEQFSYGGKRLDASLFEAKRRVRRAIKSDLLDIPLDEDKQVEVLNLFEENRLEFSGLPDHLRTLTTQELLALAELGVRLENHGWEHPHYRALSVRERCSQMRDGRDWLKALDRRFGDFFAVPYGDHAPGAEIEAAGRCWFNVAETGQPVSRESYIERVPLSV
jgi:hypothetical protein